MLGEDLEKLFFGNTNSFTYGLDKVYRWPKHLELFCIKIINIIIFLKNFCLLAKRKKLLLLHPNEERKNVYETTVFLVHFYGRATSSVFRRFLKNIWSGEK